MTWVSDMEAVRTEAAGLMRLDIIGAGNLHEIVTYASFGSQMHAQPISAVQQVLEAIEETPRKRPLLCSCCPQPLRRHGVFWIAFASPANKPGGSGLSLAVCAKCGNTRDEARACAMEAVRRVWPSARAIEIHDQVGHA